MSSVICAKLYIIIFKVLSKIKTVESNMTSLKGSASFVDTLGCRTFNLTHKKLMHILPRKRQCIHIF